MSYRNNNKSQQFGAVKRTPFCKVCFDAGKSKAEYENHYVRSLPDRTGKTIVTCPTLLSLNCRACGKAGHTIKFCPVNAAEKKAEEKAYRMAEFRRKSMEEENKNKHTQRTNVFSGLEESSDSEEEEPVSTFVVPVAPPTLSGWVQVASKAVSGKTEQELKAEQKAITDNALKRQIPPMINLVTTSKWALTESDSEGEEEEPEEVPYDYEDVTDW